MLLPALALSVFVGLSLGLLGGGGSILTTPILLYVIGAEADQAIATSLVVVGITSLAGVVQHARVDNVDWRSGLTFGAAGMAGAFAGGTGAHLVPPRILLGMFATVMAITAVGMYRGRREPAPGEIHAHGTVRFLLDGLAVGTVTGLLGAGGGFVIVPALCLLGGLPIKRAVGTSLLVIAMNTFAGYLGQSAHVGIDPMVAGGMSIAAVSGSLVGMRLSQRISPIALRRGFAVFVLGMAGFILVQQLRPGYHGNRPAEPSPCCSTNSGIPSRAPTPTSSPTTGPVAPY
ncbi:MAG: sulfite exporter TauE/SafE family protein [Myxococcota bacterium]